MLICALMCYWLAYCRWTLFRCTRNDSRRDVPGDDAGNDLIKKPLEGNHGCIVGPNIHSAAGARQSGDSLSILGLGLLLLLLTPPLAILVAAGAYGRTPACAGAGRGVAERGDAWGKGLVRRHARA